MLKASVNISQSRLWSNIIDCSIPHWYTFSYTYYSTGTTLNKAHDAATNNGAAITTKRVSISDNPFEIFKLTTLYIIIKRIKLSISESENQTSYQFSFLILIEKLFKLTCSYRWIFAIQSLNFINILSNCFSV